MGQRLAGLPIFRPDYRQSTPPIRPLRWSPRLAGVNCRGGFTGKGSRTAGAPNGIRARGYGEGAREPDHIASVLQVIVFNRVRRVS